jgi:hypothetical protein
MSVHVDTLTTEVTAEAPAPTGAETGGETPRWQDADRIAAARLRRLRDELRTHARGHDD